jgi:hypothetical protein
VKATSIDTDNRHYYSGIQMWSGMVRLHGRWIRRHSGAKPHTIIV